VARFALHSDQNMANHHYSIHNGSYLHITLAFVDDKTRSSCKISKGNTLQASGKEKHVASVSQACRKRGFAIFCHAEISLVRFEKIRRTSRVSDASAWKISGPVPSILGLSDFRLG